jgi:threonine dehydratase
VSDRVSAGLPGAPDVLAALERTSAYVEPTPLLDSPALGAVLKLETVQPTGSFKVRGAFAALTRLEPGTHVVTASAGNHGLALAYAAEKLGLDATVVVPENASPAKLEKLRAQPAELVLHGDVYDQAEHHALALARSAGHYVSPYNDADVVAGQGAIAVELLAELDGPLTLIVPSGGGGLVSGIAVFAKTRPDVRVVGVESEASPSMRAALDAGRIVPIDPLPSLCDGLGGNLEAGTITFELVRDHVDDVVVVSEDDVEEGMRHLWREHGLRVEGSAAIGVGALLAGRIDVAGRPVCVVTGMNVDEETFARVVGGE